MTNKDGPKPPGRPSNGWLQERPVNVDSLEGVLRVLDELVGAAGTMTRTNWNEIQSARAYLATLAEQAKPVAWLNRKYMTLHFCGPDDQATAAAECGELEPLYTHPAPPSALVEAPNTLRARIAAMTPEERVAMEEYRAGLEDGVGTAKMAYDALVEALRGLPKYDITNDVAENGIPIDIATLSCDGNWISVAELDAILAAQEGNK